MEKKETTPIVDDVQKWHFFNLYCLALSDEQFDLTELHTLYSIGVEHGITPEQINQLALTANIKQTVPETVEEKIECLYDLARMAWADGKIEPEEREIIRKCVVRYGSFTSENSPDIVEYFIESVKKNKSKKDILNEING